MINLSSSKFEVGAMKAKQPSKRHPPFSIQPFSLLATICQSEIPNKKCKKKKFYFGRFQLPEVIFKNRQISIFGFQCIAIKYKKVDQRFVLHIWFIAKFGLNLPRDDNLFL
jgi:hypothetical protein